MEDYKDVMLSEPPSRFTAAPAAQPISLENYKGILLCDRPADLHQRNAQDSAPPFLPAGRNDDRYVGLQPSLEHRSKLEVCRSMRQSSKISQPSAMTRHRRWLKSFASEVKQMQMDKVENELDKSEQQEKVRDKQAEERKARREHLLREAERLGISKPAESEGEEEAKQTKKAPPVANKGNQQQQLVEKHEEEKKEQPSTDAKPPLPPTTTSNTKKSSKKNKKKEKPLWAMTEDEAFDSEIAATQDLVDFAQSLDYDKFINDYEVREALAIMRDRVQEIAVEENVDLSEMRRRHSEDSGDDADERSSVASSTNLPELKTGSEGALLRKKKKKSSESKKMEDELGGSEAVHNEDWNSSTVVTEKIKTAISSDAIQLAEKILAASEAMRQIHSKQSLAMLLKEVTVDNELGKKKMTRTVDRFANAKNMDVGSSVQPPLVACVAAETMPDMNSGGAQQPQDKKRILTELRKSKNNVQNLPYMYRCPSI